MNFLMFDWFVQCFKMYVFLCTFNLLDAEAVHGFKREIS